LTPKQWAALVRLNVRLGTDTVEPIPGYGDLETLGYGKNNVVMRQAAVNHAARTDATNRFFTQPIPEADLAGLLISAAGATRAAT
jgi:hypothetical protein